jgi:AcrR family transcriptional regulator
VLSPDPGHDLSGQALEKRRRTTTEVRSAIVTAARFLFSERGYGATTTRDITAYAGVADPLLFRHFGSKSELFEQAVLEPFSDFVKQYTSGMRRRRPRFASPEESALDYLSRLYDFCIENREVALAIFMAASHQDLASELQRAVSDLNSLFNALEKNTRVESRRHGIPVARPDLAVRLTFGMVLAVTVLDDWLFAPTARQPSRDEMVAALAELVLHGVAGPGSSPRT